MRVFHIIRKLHGSFVTENRVRSRVRRKAHESKASLFNVRPDLV